MREVVSLIPYVGGKSDLVGHLYEYIDQCYRDNDIETFIEPCGGGGRLILNLPRRGHEIYSDYDIHLSDLFRAVSDEMSVVKLQKILQELPVTKEVYDFAYGVCTLKVPHYDLITDAAYAYFVNHLSFNGRQGVFKWFTGDDEHSRQQNEQILYHYQNGIDRLGMFPELLHGVDIWNGDCRWFLNEKNGFNRSNVLFMLDPPYFEDHYLDPQLLNNVGIDPHNFTYDEIIKHFAKLKPDGNLREDYNSGINLRLHLDIIHLLEHTNAKVILCGYDNSLYDHLFDCGFHRAHLKTKAVTSGKATEGTSKRTNEEYIWLNF